MRHKIFVVLLASLAVGLGTTAQVLADSQGPRSGGTFANDNVGFTFGNTPWTNPSNAISSNNSYATAAFLVSGDQSNYLKATSFGFTIPTGATIDGIKVEFERSKNISGFDSISTFSVRLVQGGTISGNDYGGTTWETTDTYETFGGTTDKWGLTWTAADINSSNFGVVVAAIADELTQAVTARVDHIRITVYYTPAPPPATAVTGYAIRPGTVLFTGKAFKEGTVVIYERGIPVRQEKIFKDDGSFAIEVLSYKTETVIYDFIFLDKDGRATPVQSFAAELALHQYITRDISPPPTISIQAPILSKGDSLLVTGYTSPRENVEIMIDDKTREIVSSGITGFYSATINTNLHNLTIGSHTVGARRKLRTGQTRLSLIKNFSISPFLLVRGDFNKDGLVNLLDWEIFRTKKRDPNFSTTFDLNNDGRISVIDLSIFLRLLILS